MRLWKDVPEAWVIEELDEREPEQRPELRLPLPEAPPAAPPEDVPSTRVIIIDL